MNGCGLINMKLKVFLKYFLGFFILWNVLSVVFNMILLGKSLDEIDYITIMFGGAVFSVLIAISKARDE